MTKEEQLEKIRDDIAGQERLLFLFRGSWEIPTIRQKLMALRQQAAVLLAEIERNTNDEKKSA